MNTCLPIDYIDPPRSKKPRKYPAITPEMHERIKKLYAEKRAKSGAVRDFAKRHGLPRWKVTRYAISNGFTSKQKKQPPWTEQELRILKNTAKHCVEVAQRKLKEAGFNRSLYAVGLKRKRMRMVQNIDGYSATQLSMCLGEDVHFVLKAINTGILIATRRITNRTEKQGGDIYFIKEKHIREFIINNVHSIDLRKVDKYWFVDMLTNI